jgi:hypothetical protein
MLLEIMKLPQSSYVTEVGYRGLQREVQVLER